MNIYIPFTYIIGWSEHKKFYYGAKYAQGCQPSDLWESYFTSSKYVKNFREENGDPDIIRIHRIFSNKNSCIIFENQYLTKIDAKNNQRFLNKSNGSDKFVAQKTSKCRKWYNDGERNYQINEAEKLLMEKGTISWNDWKKLPK